MDQDFHLIEKYFRGELNEEELQLFHSKLQKDSAFEQEFRDMKLIKEGAKASARIKALNILQDVEANLTEKETTKINVSMRRLVSIAASLIVIATVSYFAIFDRTGGTMSGDEVFTAYYESYPNIISGRERGKDIELNTLSARAYNAYDIEDFSMSATLFAELLDVEKSAENFFYSGIANLESGNLDVAKDHFNVVMNNYSQLREQSQWYLALTLLKEEDIEAGVSNLALLSLNTSSYGRESKKVLKSLDIETSFDNGAGNVEESGEIPNQGGDGTAPDGVEELRHYQYGVISDMTTRKRYDFINDYPIEGLKAGDVVSYMLIRAKKGKKPLAVLIDKLD